MTTLLSIIGLYLVGLISFIVARTKKDREIRKIFMDPYDALTNRFVRIENEAANRSGFNGAGRRRSYGYGSDNEGPHQDDLDFDLREGVHSDSMSYDSNDPY